MRTAAELRSLLARIDRRSYPAYKDTRGTYQFPGYVLSIDHVQGDPFAAPSRLSVLVKGATAAFPPALYDAPHRRLALQDALTRRFAAAAEGFSHKARGSGHSGLISVSRCGQEILERTACRLDPGSGDALVRFEVGFPANGRTVNAGELEKILFDFLPQCVERSLFYRNLDPRRLRAAADLADDQHSIRQQLPRLGLKAFVANGSVLPRASGVSDRPMADGVPFVSPRELEIALDLPGGRRIAGLGIRAGITLIVGGGYHGKSTLLKALERGVYDHIAGDGREYVITDRTAVKIRAEDGRSVRGTDISLFISGLPNGKDTASFSTEDASGSTSQAANVIESLEAGTTLLLMDEDTSATNFMVRDELMQRVIRRDMEPITPFIERVRALYEDFGVSTVLVAGSSGAYFHPADTVIQMDRYVPRDITALAKEEAARFPVRAKPPAPARRPSFARRPQPAPVDGERAKVKALPREGVMVGRELIDLRCVEQIVDPEQLAALGYCLRYAQRELIDGRRDLRQVVDALETAMDSGTLEALLGGVGGVPNLARPRRQDIFACLDRCRSLRFR